MSLQLKEMKLLISLLFFIASNEVHSEEVTLEKNPSGYSENYDKFI